MPRQIPTSNAGGRAQVFYRNPSQLVGFLVTYDFDRNGEYVELRTGRVIVSSEGENTGNCLFINDASVSPMHAIMRVGKEGVVQVLDQLSETGTRVRRTDTGDEELLSGEKATLRHGDMVMFGERKFYVCVISVEE